MLKQLMQRTIFVCPSCFDKVSHCDRCKKPISPDYSNWRGSKDCEPDGLVECIKGKEHLCSVCAASHQLAKIFKKVKRGVKAL